MAYGPLAHSARGGASAARELLCARLLVAGEIGGGGGSSTRARRASPAIRLVLLRLLAARRIAVRLAPRPPARRAVGRDAALQLRQRFLEATFHLLVQCVFHYSQCSNYVGH